MLDWEGILGWLRDQPLYRKVLAGLLIVVTICLGIVIAINREYIIQKLVDFSESWGELRGGVAILFLLIVAVSFPPLIGYSALSSFAGMVYGFPNGWFILASGTVVGSCLSFLTFRYLLVSRAKALAAKSPRFNAFVQTMDKHGSFTLLLMLRLCPLPYSLSNGAIASLHTVSLSRFALATSITTPKLLLHIFVGDRLIKLGHEKDTTTRIIDFISMALASLAGIGTGMLVYKRTQAVVNEYEQIDEVDQLAEMDGLDELDELGALGGPDGLGLLNEELTTEDSESHR